MKKNNYFFSFILILCFFFSFSYKSYANTLYDAHIGVFLAENGDAHIYTQWLFEADKHTENYIPISNLGDSEIINFKVSEDGVPFEFQKNWDINKSREQKKSKYGIVKDGGTYELCWGIGDYGTHNFEIEYIVTKMIKNLKDAQMLNFQFMNSEMSTPPRKVTLLIKGFKEFTEEDVKMWAFGFNGNIDLEDGMIVAESTSSLYSNNYVTVLLKFNKNFFSTTSYVDKTFDQVREQSFKGSDYSSSSSSSVFPKIILFLIIAVFGSIFLLIFFSIVHTIGEARKRKKKFSSLKGEYYRDIPYEGDLEDIFYILSDLKLATNKDVLTAFFLKWIKEGTVTAITEAPSSFFKKETTQFVLNGPKAPMGPLEKEYYNFTVRAAGSNGILEDNEFKRWAKINYERIYTFEKKIKANSQRILIEKGYLKRVTKKSLIFFKANLIELTPKGVELTENIIKFYNYLDNFSLLNERTSPNVHLWNEFMIFAALLGITEKVQKEFKKLYPEFDQVSPLNNNSIRSANTTSYVFYSSYRSAYNSAHRSSGGGGSSSFGGGGGSFGGGSGGGSR